MQNKQDFPTMQEYFNYRFNYKDGELYWKSHTIKYLLGEKVSSQLVNKGSDKRYQINLDGCRVIKSKVIWIMHYGDIPKGLLIDHKDRNSLNDKIENYELLTNQQNQINTDKVLQAHNTSGYRGVRKKAPNRPKPWASEIRREGKYSCKYFETAKEAAIYRDKCIDDEGLLLVKNFN